MNHGLNKMPRKYVAGLIAVALFIAGGMTTSVVLTNAQAQSNQDSWAQHQVDSVNFTAAMSNAMMSNDREAFVAFGDNKETQNHLAQFWDDTKAIGWEVGAATKSTGDSVEGMDHLNSMSFYLQLGTDARQADTNGDGTLALTTNIDYEISYAAGNQRITSFTPVIPMPWDTEEGTYVESREHVTLYGFANDAELIRKHIEKTEAYAATVVSTSKFPTEATYGRVSRIAAFVTSSQEQYSAVIDRDWGGEFEGGPTGTEDFQNSTRGMTIVTPGLVRDAESKAFTEAAVPGLASIVVVNASTPDTDVAEVVSHELAHVLFRTNQEPDLFVYAGSSNVVNEGYARYMDLTASGGLEQLRGQRLQDVVASSNLDQLMSDEAFRAPDTAANAYLASASFLYFVDQFSDYDLYWLISADSQYESMPFTLWTAYDEGITYQDWLAWLRAGE